MDDEAAARARRLVVALVWLGGLATGVTGALAGTARLGCVGGDDGLGCTTPGSVVSVLVVVGVVVVVTAVTLLSDGVRAARVLVQGVAALAVLALLFLAARTVLGSV